MVESRLSSEEMAAIAEEAYVFSFPMLMGYRACFGAFLVPSLPTYSGPMNELHGDPVTLDHNYNVAALIPAMRSTKPEVLDAIQVT